MSTGSWGEFEPRPPSDKAGPADEFDILASQTFSTGAGKRLLEMLRHKHIETGGNALAAESVLRTRAANQQFVLELERAASRGAEAMRRKSAQ